MRVTQKESDVLRSCLSWLHLHGIWCWRSNNAPIPNGRGGFRKFVGMRGCADILGVLPLPVRVDTGEQWIYGVMLAVEVKAGKGRLRKEQQAFLDSVNQMGGVGVCVRSIAELEEAISPYLDRIRCP